MLGYMYMGRNHPVIDGKVSEAMKKKHAAIVIDYSFSSGPMLYVYIRDGIIQASTANRHAVQFFAAGAPVEERFYNFALNTWVNNDTDDGTRKSVTHKTVAGVLRTVKASFEKLYHVPPGRLVISRFFIDDDLVVPHKFIKSSTIVHKIRHNESTAALEEMKKRMAARKIQRAFLKSYYDPAHPIGRRRLMGEYTALTG